MGTSRGASLVATNRTYLKYRYYIGSVLSTLTGIFTRGSRVAKLVDTIASRY